MIQGTKEIDVGKLDLALVDAALHIEALNGLRDQLVIYLLRTIADAHGRAHIPATSLDAAGRYTVACCLSDGFFDFVVTKAD
jgi:hypothetical protein